MNIKNSTARIKKVKNEYDDGLNKTYGIVYRSEYSRDYARVLHSSSFRRLGNKTQLFPAYESDFFRTRLTHSLEVAQIAKSIAEKFKKREKQYSFIEPEVCEIAGLIHDIGHPPFGHNGEKALDDCMKSCGGFEGNAQTLHIIARLEKKETPESKDIFNSTGNDCRYGLNLTVRSIAAGLKYDEMIPTIRKDTDSLLKGYYECDKEVVEFVKDKLIGKKDYKPFKTIECAIMDIADDISYSTYDLEDAFKAGFLTPYKMLSADETIYEKIAEKLNKDKIVVTANDCRNIILDLFKELWVDPINKQKELEKSNKNYSSETFSNFLNSYLYSKKLASNGYMRTQFTSMLVSKFIEGITIELNEDCPLLSNIKVEKETEILINILKHFSYVYLINSAMLKVVENRGYEIIKTMFERFTKSEDGYKLLPEDFQFLYFKAPNEAVKKRVICDFIAGMTDRYALEFYGRLFSENPQTIFKPL